MSRILLGRQEAAGALGMSLSHFQRHAQPFIPCVYSGRLRLYRPIDLERWAERESSEPDPPHEGGGVRRRRSGGRRSVVGR